MANHWPLLTALCLLILNLGTGELKQERVVQTLAACTD